MSDDVLPSAASPSRKSALVRWLRSLRRLFARPREPYRPSADPFLELDLSAVRAELRPKERGRGNGAHNLPHTDSTSLDEVERRIVAFIVNEQKRAHEQYQSQLQVFNERVRSMEINILHSNVAGRVQAAAADLVAMALRGKNELFELQRQVTALAREVFEFRCRHGLQREPQYPESKLWHWAILILILLAETILNGLMLSRGTIGGLLEGFSIALVLAVINLSVGGVIGGVALPLTRRVSWSLRVVCAVVLFAAIIFSVGFNLVVGHYRDALGGPAPEFAARESLTTFFSQPFQLADLNSWLLCVLGLLFAVIAVIDTYRMDDPYWGYGPLARRAQRVRDDFIGERRHLIEEATQRRNEHLDLIHRTGQEISRAGAVLRLRETDSPGLRRCVCSC